MEINFIQLQKALKFTRKKIPKFIISENNHRLNNNPEITKPIKKKTIFITHNQENSTHTNNLNLKEAIASALDRSVSEGYMVETSSRPE